MTRAAQWATILDELGPVRYELSCVVPDEPVESAVVRHAKPIDDTARQQMREQAIAKLQRDPAAILHREMRIALARPNVTPFRRRA